MYVCMYAYMYAYMYVCMYVCLYVCMYAYMYVCMYVCMYKYFCMYKYICTYFYIYMYIFTCIRNVLVCVCVCVCLCILTPHASLLQSSRSRDETVLELINIFDEATRSAATTESLTSVDPSLQLSGYVVCTVLYITAVYYIIFYCNTTH
jgi:hypothetical protein